MAAQQLSENPHACYCRTCGHDLRASRERCPECGRAFDPEDPRSFLRRPRQPWKRRALAAGVLGTVLMLALLLAYTGLFLVQWHYPVRVNNNPLQAPVKVVRVNGNIVELADGRRLGVFAMDPLDEAVKTSGYQVDVVIENGETVLYGMRPFLMCGTPWARGLFHIRLIPDYVPAHYRNLIGTVDTVLPPLPAQTQPTSAPPPIP